MHYDAVLVVSFGGPEQPEDVIPFLENVLRGRNVPARAHAPGGGALLPLRRPQPDQRAMPGPDRGTAPGQPPAGLLGQSQLASHAGRYPAADGARGREAGAGHRDLGLLFLFRLPPVHREHRSGSRRRSARARRSSTNCRRFADHPLFVEANADRVARGPGRTSRRPAGLHRAQHFPRPWPIRAATKSSSAAHPAAWRSCAGMPRGISSGKAAAGRPPSPGWNPISSTTCARLPRAACAGSWSRRSDSSPITWKSGTIWTWKPRPSAGTWASNACRAGTPGVHPKIVAMFAETIEQRLAACEPLLCPEGCCPAPPRRPAALADCLHRLAEKIPLDIRVLVLIN